MDAAAIVGWGFAIGLIAGGLGLWVAPQVKSLAWRGRLPRGWGALPVEDVPADEAPRGWKCAQLLVTRDGWRVHLAGIAIGGVYRAEDTAVCAYNRDHDVPDLGCECGFYAFRDRAEAAALLACAVGFGGSIIVRTLCEVDLTGTVIECDNGYRAESQRVLRVSILPWCAPCAVRGTLAVASHLGADSSGDPRSFALRTYAHQAASRSVHPSVRERISAVPLRPLCDGCASEIDPAGVAMTLVDVSNALGTEVVWLDPGIVAPKRVLSCHRPRPPWAGSPG